MLVQRMQLLHALELVQPGLAASEVVEQSNCFVFRDGKVLTFNDEVACSMDSGLGGFTGAVPAKPLAKLLTKMTEEEIDVDTADTESFTVKGRGRRAGIRMNPEIKLPIDSLEAPKAWKELPEDFKDAVAVTVQCVSRDDAAGFATTCVHITNTGLEACDNFQIARFPITLTLKRSALVKGQNIKHVCALDMQEYSETKNWLHFKNSSGMVLSCRRYSDTEEFPDLNTFLNVTGKPATLPGGLAEAVTRASVFSGEASEDAVMIQLRPGKMAVRGEGPQGWYEERKKIEYEGDPLSFLIAPKLLVDICSKHNEVILGKGRMKVDGKRFQYVTCLGNAGEE